jgi:hypothetical protein
VFFITNCEEFAMAILVPFAAGAVGGMVGGALAKPALRAVFAVPSAFVDAWQDYRMESIAIADYKSQMESARVFKKLEQYFDLKAASVKAAPTIESSSSVGGSTDEVLAAIRALKSDVGSIKSDVEELTGRIATLEGKKRAT